MAEDFGQKNRSRPIKITDIAISKVPRTELAGFSEEENMFIQDQHKLLLTISKDKNQSKEVGILIDIINWNTWVIPGEANEIETKNKGTFSGTDFKTFCLNDSLYIMTVVGNDGNVRMLTKLSGFDGGEALSYYSKLATQKYKEFKNNGTMAMRELLKNGEKIKVKYEIGGR